MDYDDEFERIDTLFWRTMRTVFLAACTVLLVAFWGWVIEWL